MASELLRMLATAALASCVALALVIGLRRGLRAAFGVGVAYAAWAIVPAAMLAALLPRAEAPATLAPVRAALAPLTAIATTTTSAAGDGHADAALLFAWLAGALAVAAYFAWCQRAFVRGLGRLVRRPDGLLASSQTRGLPAAIGVWRARIVVPADYEQRYDAQQRRLLEAHEAMHVARGDIRVNALVAALRCVFWFNPLIHLAAGAFRRDQELSCDRRVLMRHPGSARAYGEAMFHTQLAAQGLPVGCQWSVIHPLKERIAMLTRPMPSRLRRFAGSASIALLLCATALGAWAAQPVAASKPHAASKSDLPAVPASDTVAMPVETTPPEYPKQALDQHKGGQVVMLIVVGKDGSVQHVTVEKATPRGLFEAAATKAASQWKFHPATSHGKPVESVVRIPIQFDPQMTVRPKAG